MPAALPDAEDVVRRLSSMAGAAAGLEGCDVVDVEVRRRPRKTSLVVTIDSPEGVSVDVCAQVSRRLSDDLDAAATELADDYGFREPYVLEVSSPGLTRPLKRLDDYRRFRGRLALVTLRRPLDGANQVRGVITEVSDAGDIRLEDERDGSEVNLPWALVARGRLDFDPAKPPQRRV